MCKSTAVQRSLSFVISVGDLAVHNHRVQIDDVKERTHGEGEGQRQKGRESRCSEISCNVK